MMISNEEAMIAVVRMSAAVKFMPSGDIERSEIADVLTRMVNWPPERKLHRQDTEPPAEIPYTPPAARLERFVQVMINGVVEWPGIAEMRAIYCKLYKPADGIERGGCGVPGFTDLECQGGTDFLSLQRPPEQKYLPQPGDERITPEFIREIAAGAKLLEARR